MRFAAALLGLTLTPTAVFAARPTSQHDSVTVAPLAINFSVDTKTAVPGATLSPGQYTISIVEHLSDRVILQIADKNGKVKSLFLGLTTTSLPSSGSAGPIVWTGKGSPALRGYLFPGAPPVEFVYPKAQAVTIAKGNTDQVLAIDPASDNLSILHDRLSKQDMQIVTLWTLKSTRVGSESGIEAAKYQVPAAPAIAASQTTYVARATPPPPPPVPAGRRSVTQKPALTASAAPVEGASPARKPSISVLPHTASNLPAVFLLALLALLGSAGVRLRRLYANEV